MYLSKKNKKIKKTIAGESYLVLDLKKLRVSFPWQLYAGNMEFLQWSCHDVAEWIESFGFPQYRVS